MKIFDKSKVVVSKNILFRAATATDAAFVFELRKDQKKACFLSKIHGSLEDQARWLDRCHADPYQIYFVICSRNGESLGLVRIYDQKADSFCWGSWIIKDGSPASTAIESALLVYRFSIDIMKFNKSHFQVRIGNDSVIKFHKKFGAVEVGRSNQDIFFEMDSIAIRRALTRYSKYLPEEE